MSALTLNVRVLRRWVEAIDICAFELVEAYGGLLPAFSAGSHIDVLLPNGMTRQYSLCNDPSESHRYLIGVLKDSSSRGGSEAMHELVDEGATLQISPPRNHFPLAHEASRSILVAGGIGVTPILCMAERLSTSGADFEMHYCARSRQRTAFLQRVEAARYSQKVRFHFDDGPAEQRLEIGDLVRYPTPRTHLYVCGPKGFMDAILNAARAAGWPQEQLHYEFFAAGVVKAESDGAFIVRLASSGRIVHVGKDNTVTEALAQAGVAVHTSCEQGVCGTCLTRVLEGVPDHRDLYLTPAEQARNDQFTPCCSRSKSSELVLDL